MVFFLSHSLVDPNSTATLYSYTDLNPIIHKIYVNIKIKNKIQSTGKTHIVHAHLPASNANHWATRLQKQ